MLMDVTSSRWWTTIRASSSRSRICSSRLGYEARVYPSGPPLLASGTEHIDLLITDVGLPFMDGFELRDRVKQARPELPVIVISGRRDLAHGQSSDDHGYTDFFRKPFDGQALLNAISQALGAP